MQTGLIMRGVLLGTRVVNYQQIDKQNGMITNKQRTEIGIEAYSTGAFGEDKNVTHNVRISEAKMQDTKLLGDLSKLHSAVVELSVWVNDKGHIYLNKDAAVVQVQNTENLKAVS